MLPEVRAGFGRPPTLEDPTIEQESFERRMQELPDTPINTEQPSAVFVGRQVEASDIPSSFSEEEVLIILAALDRYWLSLLGELTSSSPGNTAELATTMKYVGAIQLRLKNEVGRE